MPHWQPHQRSGELAFAGDLIEDRAVDLPSSLDPFSRDGP